MMGSWSRATRRCMIAAMMAASVGATLSVDAFSASKSKLDRELNLFGEVIQQIQANYVDKPDDAKMMEGAINGMLAALDPHSSYMSQKEYERMSEEISGTFGGVGLEIQAEHDAIRIVTVIGGTPAARSGLKSNDVIVKIDNDDTDGMPLEKAVDRMHGAPGSKVTLTVTRKGVDAPISVTLRREIINVSPVEQRAEGNVAYIKVTTFNGQTAEKLAAAIAATKKAIGPGLKGYVLDLRNNPGGLLEQAIAVTSEAVAKGRIVSIKGRSKADTTDFDADGSDLMKGKPIVVLINGATASAAEIVAGALQDDKRAIVVGTRSFGKGTVQTILPLGGSKGALRLTTARYFTPSGRSIQAKGIDPDVLVEEKVPDSVKAAAAEGALTGGEQSLANHLRNPDGEAAEAGTARSIPYVPENSADDTQLNYALDLLNRLPAGTLQVNVPRPAPELASRAPAPPAPAVVPN